MRAASSSSYFQRQLPLGDVLQCPEHMSYAVSAVLCWSSASSRQSLGPEGPCKGCLPLFVSHFGCCCRKQAWHGRRGEPPSDHMHRGGLAAGLVQLLQERMAPSAEASATPLAALILSATGTCATIASNVAHYSQFCSRVPALCFQQAAHS